MKSSRNKYLKTLIICALTIIIIGYIIKLKTNQSSTNYLIEEDLINVGTINLDTLNTFNFSIVNTGDSRLIIHDIVPDCMCTTVKLNTKTAAPKDTILLAVVVKQDIHGYFQQNILVHCNTLNSPFLLTIQGFSE